MRALDASRHSLTEAAKALAEFRRVCGAAAGPEDPSTVWRAPVDAGVRNALLAARERVRQLEAELAAARGERDAALEERRLLAAERGPQPQDGAQALHARVAQAESRAAAAESRLTSLQERARILEAEFVRLESLRRNAERAVADGEAAARVVEEA
ncbi:MAG: hypothetical protein HYZ74_04485, partial [Elusimicrobia bacterium]|nr:hypothetical protein [Elusimicrobiota bacterium]